MKKYILLATTAVLMTTANAFADPVTVSVPALGVKAKLTPLAAFTKTDDLDFGGMVFDKTDLGTSDYVSFVYIVSDQMDYYADVKAHYGTLTAGKYTYSGSLNLNGGKFTIGGNECTLLNGYCSIEADITFGANAKSNQTILTCTESPKSCEIVSNLFVKKDYLESLDSTGTINENLTITYNYE